MRLVHDFGFIMRMLLGFIAISCLVVWQTKSEESQINLKDALYLTKNSIKEWRKQHLDAKKHHIMGDSNQNEISHHNLNYDSDMPFNNVVNTFFPIDCLIKYNELAGPGQLNNYTEHEFLGRYASFSPILNEEINGEYRIFPDNACISLNSSDYEDFSEKIIVLMRGGCTFVNKVSNIIKADIKPRAIIIGNNEPNRGLVTMYSSTFNEDGTLSTPIIFITYESFKILENRIPIHNSLCIFTASMSGWFNVILSMSLSPPLLILIFYLLIKGFQFLKKREISRINNKLVKSLPVYVYNKSHLILSSQLPNYLKITGQTAPSSIMSSTDSFKTPAESSESLIITNNYVVNGVDLKASANALHILLSTKDFYPSYKCSICLEKFKPLNSKVLVLECKHFYHENCLSNWLINFKRSCPLCNCKFKQPDHPYILVDNHSDYGAINDEDLEAQVHLQGNNTFVSENSAIDSNTHDESIATLPSFVNREEYDNEPQTSLSPTTSGTASELSSSGVSESQSSYFSTSSKFESTSSNRLINFYQRPSQILVQLSAQSSLDLGHESELSSSIDLEKFGTPQSHSLSNQISSSTESESTIMQRRELIEHNDSQENSIIESIKADDVQDDYESNEEDYFDDMVMA